MRVTEEAKQRNSKLRSEMYQWYVSHGICPYCGTRYPEPGRVLCVPCKRRIKVLRERNDPGNVKHKAYNHERREKLKAAGLCTDCGKASAMEGRIRCAKCEEKMKDSRKKWEIVRRIDREAEEARARNG